MPKSFDAKMIVLILLIVVASVLYAGFYTIEQGTRGIHLRFGEVIAVEEAGFHFKIPQIDTIKEMSIRTDKYVKTIEIYSKDVQGATVLLSVNYALNPKYLKEIYTKFGLNYAERIIEPLLISKPKDVFGQYNAVNIVQMREQVTKGILAELEKAFKDTGIMIRSVQIENIDFSDSYEKSVEERMKAEVEVQKVKQNLEREKLNADMVRTKAQGEADAKLAKAEAEAKSILTISKAEAEAIRIKSQALTTNLNYISLIQAERWNGVLPQTMIPNDVLPVLNLKPIQPK